MTEETILQIDKDLLREGLSKYTRKAFHILPELDKPRILDVGCGSGVPTMELAKLSNGQIIGLDVNQPSLDRLKRKAEKAGLSDRVKVMKCSMVNMDFPNESFDIIWAEGSIAVIGFKRGLKEWRQLLKPNRFLAVHDEIGDITEKLEQISSCGYDLLEYFTLNDDTWWMEYYAPLEKRINEIRIKHANDPKALAVLDEEQREIDMFKKNPGRYCSVFFIMKKR
ncbi:2-methoxy-6-polyprenyl-1,4-benzoquinol methylase [subsurface metagenome]